MSNMKHLISFSIFLLSSYAYSQNDSTILYIKNGSIIHIVVSKIYDRALIDSQNHGVSFRVIDSLWTADSSVAKRFNELDAGIKPREHNQGFLLDLTKMNVAEYKPSTTAFLQLKTHSYIYYPSTSHRVGIQLDYLLFSLDGFILRSEETLGLQSKQAPFSDINFNVGLGYELESNWFIFKTIVGYGIYAREKGIKGENRTGSTIFISPTIQLKLAREYSILILFGFNVSIYHSLIGIPEDAASCYAGFGFQL